MRGDVSLQLLCAYGVCFGIRNKLGALVKGASRFTDALLRCSYCTGFHSGWLTWVLLWATSLWDVAHHMREILGFSLASAAFCYLVDTLALKLEKPSPH